MFLKHFQTKWALSVRELKKQLENMRSEAPLSEQSHIDTILNTAPNAARKQDDEQIQKWLDTATGIIRTLSNISPTKTPDRKTESKNEMAFKRRNNTTEEMINNSELQQIQWQCISCHENLEFQKTKTVSKQLTFNLEDDTQSNNDTIFQNREFIVMNCGHAIHVDEIMQKKCPKCNTPIIHSRYGLEKSKYIKYMFSSPESKKRNWITSVINSFQNTWSQQIDEQVKTHDIISTVVKQSKDINTLYLETMYTSDESCTDTFQDTLSLLHILFTELNVTFKGIRDFISTLPEDKKIILQTEFLNFTIIQSMISRHSSESTIIDSFKQEWFNTRQMLLMSCNDIKEDTIHLHDFKVQLLLTFYALSFLECFKVTLERMNMDFNCIHLFRNHTQDIILHVPSTQIHPLFSLEQLNKLVDVEWREQLHNVGLMFMESADITILQNSNKLSLFTTFQIRQRIYNITLKSIQNVVELYYLFAASVSDYLNRHHWASETVNIIRDIIFECSKTFLDDDKDIPEFLKPLMLEFSQWIIKVKKELSSVVQEACVLLHCKL